MLGDIPLVMRDKGLTAEFLALPLPGVLALLGSDELKVRLLRVPYARGNCDGGHRGQLWCTHGAPRASLIIALRAFHPLLRLIARTLWWWRP